jgi:hypothetical protein
VVLEVELTPEIERELSRAAADEGLPLADYALKVLRCQAQQNRPKRTPAELVAEWEREGVLGIWADHPGIGDSSEFAAQLRAQAENRVHGD